MGTIFRTTTEPTRPAAVAVPPAHLLRGAHADCGPEALAALTKLLGLESLTPRPKLTSGQWDDRRLTLSVETDGETRSVLLLPAREVERALVRAGDVAIVHDGDALPPSLEDALRGPVTAALRKLRLDDLAAPVVGDPTFEPPAREEPTEVLEKDGLPAPALAWADLLDAPRWPRTLGPAALVRLGGGPSLLWSCYDGELPATHAWLPHPLEGHGDAPASRASAPAEARAAHFAAAAARLADGTAESEQTGGVSLVGFPRTRGTAELEDLLRDRGVAVDARLLPDLSAATIAATARAALDVVLPSPSWDPIYGQLLLAAGRPYVAPVAPLGVARTRAWLNAVAAAAEVHDDAAAAGGPEAERLLRRAHDAEQRQRTAAAGIPIGVVVRSWEAPLLAREDGPWGLPIAAWLRESGFRLNVIVAGPTPERAATARSWLAERLQGDDVTLRACHEPEGLTAALQDAEATGFLAADPCDARVTSAGKVAIGLDAFELGASGGARTVARLAAMAGAQLHRLWRDWLPSRARPVRAESPPPEHDDLPQPELAPQPEPVVAPDTPVMLSVTFQDRRKRLPDVSFFLCKLAPDEPAFHRVGAVGLRFPERPPGKVFDACAKVMAAAMRGRSTPPTAGTVDEWRDAILSVFQRSRLPERLDCAVEEVE